jgi:hypothetical protein
MDDAPRIVCPTCRQEVDPADPATIQAYEQVPSGSFGEEHDVSDGMKAAFHPGCFDATDPRYRRID